jgi:hypothetical protein
VDAGVPEGEFDCDVPGPDGVLDCDVPGPDGVFDWEVEVPEFVVDVVDCCWFVVFVVFVGGGPIPEAANAAAGATVSITGTLQPALSIVRREMPPRRSEAASGSELRRGTPFSECLFI